MTKQTGRIFLITGVSTGLGRAVARGALQAGHTVAGTVRQAPDAKAFHALEPERAHPYLLDVTHDREVARVVDDVESTVGPIDVLICNAGYGHEGLIEESTMQQLRDQFAVNVFGAVAVIKAVLPHMRSRRAGHIVTVTAMGGLTTFPGTAILIYPPPSGRYCPADRLAVARGVRAAAGSVNPLPGPSRVCEDGLAGLRSGDGPHGPGRNPGKR